MRNIFNGGARDAQAVLSALDRSLAVVEFDMQGNILRANRQFCAATGYAVSELVGRHHSMFVDETTAAGSGYREFWNKLQQGEFLSGDFARIAKGGRLLWLHATYNPVRGRKGICEKVVKFATTSPPKSSRRRKPTASWRPFRARRPSSSSILRAGF